MYLSCRQAPVPEGYYNDAAPVSMSTSKLSMQRACFLSSRQDILRCDDGHGDYNRSYEQNTDDFDYADYSTAKEDNNFPTRQKKKKRTQKQIIEDILNRWD